MSWAFRPFGNRAQVGTDVRLTIQNDANQTQAVALLLNEQAANITAADFLFIA